MTALLAFLPRDAEPYTLERLELELANLFISEDRPQVTNPIRPFIGDKHIHFNWGGRWGFNAYLEAGVGVSNDAQQIQEQFGEVFPEGLPNARVRLTFGIDPSMEFTNHIIWVWEHFSLMPGVVIYDLSQNRLCTE